MKDNQRHKQNAVLNVALFQNIFYSNQLRVDSKELLIIVTWNWKNRQTMCSNIHSFVRIVNNAKYVYSYIRFGLVNTINTTYLRLKFEFWGGRLQNNLLNKFKVILDRKIFWNDCLKDFLEKRINHSVLIRRIHLF